MFILLTSGDVYEDYAQNYVPNLYIYIFIYLFTTSNKMKQKNKRKMHNLQPTLASKSVQKQKQRKLSTVVPR